MTRSSKLGEARTTCDGLHRLVRQLNGAAVDVDNGGASAHELLALLATANECVNSLSVQLEALEAGQSSANTSGSVSRLRVVEDPLMTPAKAVSTG